MEVNLHCLQIPGLGFLLGLELSATLNGTNANVEPTFLIDFYIHQPQDCLVYTAANNLLSYHQILQKRRAVCGLTRLGLGSKVLEQAKLEVGEMVVWDSGRWAEGQLLLISHLCTRIGGVKIIYWSQICSISIIILEKLLQTHSRTGIR